MYFFFFWCTMLSFLFFFFFQAEDGIRDHCVTGVQTCALPISDQYTNRANPEAHYESTGPEIWEQTGGELDALVIAVGTGGTISGAGRYIKEQNADALIVGADPEGSIYTAGDAMHPYLVEGIGEDFYPETF